MNWSIVDTGIASAETNMALDVQLLEDLASGLQKQPILHFYDWQLPSATYGYFTDPYQLLDAAGVNQLDLQLARRPTGGGIIFHLADFAFSILVPANHRDYSVNILDNYAFVNRLVIEVIKGFTDQHASLSLLPIEPAAIDRHAGHFCMASPTKYDVILDGYKVGGGAQRRTKHGFLHQGSISLALPDLKLLQQVLLPGTRVIEAMQQHTCALLHQPTQPAIKAARARLRELMQAMVS